MFVKGIPKATPVNITCPSDLEKQDPSDTWLKPLANGCVTLTEPFCGRVTPSHHPDEHTLFQIINVHALGVWTLLILHHFLIRRTLRLRNTLKSVLETCLRVELKVTQELSCLALYHSGYLYPRDESVSVSEKVKDCAGNSWDTADCGTEIQIEPGSLVVSFQQRTCQYPNPGWVRTSSVSGDCRKCCGWSLNQPGISWHEAITACLTHSRFDNQPCRVEKSPWRSWYR